MASWRGNVIKIIIVPQQTPLFNVILLAAGGFFMFVCMDSTAKYLGTVMPITQAIWGRFFFHLISIIVFFLFFRPKVNLKKNFKLQIIRSVLMVTATTFMFHSLQKFDLVDIYVVFFTAPLIVSLLSAYFLKDFLTFKGIILILLSFGSIIYALGPSMKIFSMDLIFPIVPPICWALYQFLTKVISTDNDPFAAIFYTSILGAIIFSIYMSFYWMPLEKNIYWFYLILLGVAGFVSHSLIIYAIQLSNLSFVTNFQYSQLVWSTIINFMIFGVPIDVNKIYGVIGIIVFGILFIKTEGSKKKVKIKN